MLRNSIYTIALFLFFVGTVNAQKKIVLEPIRYATAINYLHDPAHLGMVVASLDASLHKYFQTGLSDTSGIRLVRANMQSSELSLRHGGDKDSSCLHLLLDVAEYSTGVFFDHYMDLSDSLLRVLTTRVFRTELRFFRHDGSIQFGNGVDIFVGHARGQGLGLPSPAVPLLPRSFVEIMKSACSNMLDTVNGMSQLMVKTAPVYMADNYLVPQIKGKPRIIADTAKGVIAYISGNERKMLRLGEPFYEELQVRGKKADRYPEDIKKAARKAPNASSSEFVCLKQESRDVLADKNYLLEIYTQINPEAPPQRQELLFTNFLPGQIHTLTSEKDTLARFAIQKYITDTANKIFPGVIYNGLDSENMVTLPGLHVEIPLVYEYLVDGTLSGSAFRIKCSGQKGFVKEIYFREKLVCIAQGAFRPEVFAVFDASLSTEILNQLFIIGFNRFFE